MRRVRRGSCQLQPVSDAVHMSVYGDALRVFECFAHDAVSRLASHARKLLQKIHVSRHLSAELSHDGLRQRHQILRLSAKEAERMDDLLDLGRMSLGHGLRGRKALEERGRYLVDGGIGALG